MFATSLPQNLSVVKILNKIFCINICYFYINTYNFIFL